MEEILSPGSGKPVVEPSDFVGDYRAPTDRFILVFSRKSLSIVKRLMEGVERIKAPIPALSLWSGTYKEARIGLVHAYFGAPATAMALETLIASGVKHSIVLGFCGSLSPRLRLNDVLIPVWGVRGEGTSHYYLPPQAGAEPDPELTRGLYKHLKRVKGRRKFRVLRGGIWSTDAFFRETRDKVEKLGRRGVLGVDMEATALMIIAKFRGARLALALLVTDELHTPAWRTIFGDKKLVRKALRVERLMAQAALNLLSSI